MLATKERLHGFRNALKKNKIKPDPTFIVSTDLSRESTYKAIHHLLSLEKKPTAVIAFNDYVALDAIQYAKKSKLKANRNIPFVSFANLPICNYMETPPLASVEQFPYLQGKKAAEILLQLLDENKKDFSSGRVPYKIILETKLEVHS
jgi:LacI family repressor for deo operon, udp, cdd, tsx, nupC, and nupG